DPGGCRHGPREGAGHRPEPRPEPVHPLSSPLLLFPSDQAGTPVALVTRTYSLDDPDALRRWQALWEISPQRSPFSMPSYVRAAAEAYALAAAFHFVEDGERDEAALVAFWKQKGPYRLGVVPTFMPYSPLLLRRDVKDHEVHDGTSALDHL